MQCRVQQGDPLSCPLFVAVIEGLACMIMEESRISGVIIDGHLIKTTMFADDTTIILKTQEEADAVMSILHLYGLASGAKINLPKSYLLLIDRPFISIPKVKLISSTVHYVHLGISVGEDLEDHLKVFWEGMLEKLRRIAAVWLRLHLSLRGRVLIANALMMSITRYAVRFLDVPGQVRKDLQKEYYWLVWDDKSSSMIKDLHACCKVSDGGVGCFDLETIANTAAGTVVARTLTCPTQPWVALTKEIIIESALGRTPLLTEAISSPWLQWLGSKHKIPDEIGWVWSRWKKMIGDGDSGIVRMNPPQTLDEVLNTYFWYHPIIGKASGSGPKKWGSQIWKTL